MQPGSTIAGKFRVERVLGQGGMGVVVVATHLQLEQTVALKFLHQEIVSSPEVMERLLREARASAKLKSEHVCRVMDVGQLDSGAPYIVMELLEGEDLSARIKRAPLSPAMAAELVMQGAVAVAEAHAAGLVHRDLKPANLFVTQRLDGSPLIKVLDFGIAKAAKADTQLTRTTAIMGSPSYMSPEQLRSSKTVDHRTDIWALGVVLYEIVSGLLPFRSDTITELAVKVSMDEPEPLPLHTDPAYVAVVMKCLQKKPEDRYQSIAELADALAPIAGAGASTSAAMIARLSGRQAAVAAPPPTAQQPVSAPPPVTQPAPMPGFVPVAPTQPVMHHGLPATASARMPIGVGEAQGTPGSKMWLWGLIGGAAMIAIVAIIALTRGDPEAEVAREAGKPDKPIAIAEVPGKEVGKGSGSASTIEVEAALKFLDQAYAQQNNNQPGTREEALRFLDKMYAQQLASKADAQDPTAVYAVHVGDAVAAGQLEGPRDALVTIVVAFDLACPFCAKLSPTISELIAQYPNKVRAVYMNMVVHPTVQTAHRYGCAAAKQGKFIAFERAFYEGPFQKYRDAGGKNPDILDQRGIQPLASTLGLDIVKLANDANFCAERIEADQIELRRFKVSGTPTMFINGKYVGGALPKEQLEKLVVEQLKIAEASGVPAARYYEQEIVGKGLRELRSAPTKPPTRDDAVAYLVEAYRTQMAQEAARDAETLDPDAVFAVDIAPAVAAKQVLGGPAAVTVVVISDFVCPYCRKVDAVLHDLYGEYAGQLRIVFMHMIVHPDTATVGHQYACAAGLQGKFAAFAELWWKNSFDPYAASSGRDKSIFSEAKVLGYAGRLGVSMSRLKADANGDECRSRIAGDQAEARKFKVSGTPTMFINGKVIPGFVQKDAMKTLIDEQLKRVEQSGTPAAEYYDREVFAKGLRQFRAKSSKP